MRVLVGAVLRRLREVLRVGVTVYRGPRLRPFSAFPMEELIVGLVIRFGTRAFVGTGPTLTRLVDERFCFRGGQDATRSRGLLRYLDPCSSVANHQVGYGVLRVDVAIGGPANSRTSVPIFF